ncbi:hypothetical protein LZ31DRAFT_217695 [Colletotrichum somersetense]|nr:hypothetical protein LZ31DRAFT_217695 [Colletotrichum somersetense]
MHSDGAGARRTGRGKDARISPLLGVLKVLLPRASARCLAALGSESPRKLLLSQTVTADHIVIDGLFSLGGKTQHDREVCFCRLTAHLPSFCPAAPVFAERLLRATSLRPAWTPRRRRGTEQRPAEACRGKA